MNTTRIDIRWMIRRDYGTVLRIEGESFPCPWTEADLLGVLRATNCIGMVAVRGDDVVGYSVMVMHRNHLEVGNLAVDAGQQRKGVATELIHRVKAKLSPHRRPWISVKVRESNLPAQLFFAAQGFKAVGLLRGFYEVTDEDAVLMQYQL